MKTPRWPEVRRPWDQGKGPLEIAEMLGEREDVVRKHLYDDGVAYQAVRERRDREKKRALPTHLCENSDCGHEFQAKRQVHSRFCSTHCQTRAKTIAIQAARTPEEVRAIKQSNGACIAITQRKAQSEVFGWIRRLQVRKSIQAHELELDRRAIEDQRARQMNIASHRPS